MAKNQDVSTKAGRQAVKDIASIASAMGWKVYYGDTDTFCVDMSAARVVTLGNIRAYMLSTGWTCEAFNGVLDKFWWSDHDVFQMVPASEDLEGYRYRAWRIIDNLAVIEDRPVETVLADIINKTK